MRPRKKVSQQRIAQEMGISQALVSLALNGRKEGINPETYKAIWDHAISLGYQPKGMKLEQSPAARPRHVGIILRAGLAIHNQGSYFGLVLHGLHTALSEQGYTTVFVGSEEQLDDSKLAATFSPGHSLLGVVMLGEVSATFLKRLKAHETRLVAISARHPGHCHSVIGNESQALDQVVGHLHELGHRRIGWIGGNTALARHTMRYDGFKEALASRGLSLDPRYSALLAQGDRAEGAEAMLSLLEHRRRKDFPTAFVAYNTLMAAGAVKAALREGLRIPQDLSLAGADSSALAKSERPTITVAGSDAERLGAAAARLVLQAESSQDGFTDLILPAVLSPGESTGAA